MSDTPKKVETPSLEKVLNYPQNVRYLELKKKKFWHIIEEKRRELTPSNKEEAQIKEFNSDYIKVNGVPPFSALRIKNGSGYQLYYTSDLSKMTFAKIHLVPQEGNSPCNPVTEEDIKRVKIQLP